jgi:hypothetical protein
LRGLFTRAPQLAERIRDFRLEPVAKIAAGDTPARLQEPDATIIHVVPFSAFDKKVSLPLTDVFRFFHTLPRRRADALNADELAGAPIVLAETKEAGKREAWAKRGAAFF